MKIYTGIDIIEVNRIKENIEKYGEQFLNKIYTQNEIEYSESKKIQKCQTYAGRFAGKEAVFKAISPMLKNKFDIGWKDIEILNDENGRPFVRLKALDGLKFNFDISISHVENVAISNVVLVIYE